MSRLAEELGVLLRPVAADDAHQLDGREEAGGAGKVAGRAAEQVFAATPGGFDGVYGDGADDEEGHSAGFRIADREVE